MQISLSQVRAWVIGHLGSIAIVAVPSIVIVLSLGYLYQGSLGETAEQETLQEQVARLEALRGPSTGKLEEVTEQFNRVQEALPAATLAEIAVFKDLLAKVEAHGLTAIISFKGQTNEQVGSTTYRQMSFSMTAAGDSESLWELLEELDSGPEDLPTLVLKTISLRFGGGAQTTEVAFVIYTQ